MSYVTSTSDKNKKNSIFLMPVRRFLRTSQVLCRKSFDRFSVVGNIRIFRYRLAD